MIDNQASRDEAPRTLPNRSVQDDVIPTDPCPWLLEAARETSAKYDPSWIYAEPPEPFDAEMFEPEAFGQEAFGPDELGSERMIGDPSTDSVVRPLDDLDRLLDDLQVADVELSRAQAHRAALLAQANTWAETMVDAVVPIGATQPHRREMAHRSVVAEVSCALRVPQQTVAAEIDTAATLIGMPETMASLREGKITYRHVQVIVDTCQSVPVEGRGGLEAELLPIAEASTVAQLRRKARAARERAHPQPLIERTQEAVAGRRVAFEDANNGMAWIHHYLPVVSAVGIYETTSQMATSMLGGSESRTVDQLRSDILTELIDEGVNVFLTESAESRNSKKEPGTKSRRVGAVRPSVFVTMPAFSMMGLSDEPAVLEGYGPIDAATARALTADAPGFYRVLTDPFTGTILDVDRKQYRPPADLRRWLRLRDQTCRWPFCGKRAIHSDIDHTIPWGFDGRTRNTNLAHLCPGDHTVRHGASWQVTQDAGGVLHWTSPTGRCYTTVPETPPGRQAVQDALALLARVRAAHLAEAGATSAGAPNGAAEDSPAPF